MIGTPMLHVSTKNFVDTTKSFVYADIVKLPKPTAGELEILAVLWRIGPATVRNVHDQLDQSTGYTTVLKLMQIMAEKGLLQRDESERAHVYKTRVARVQTQGQLMKDFLEKAFENSAAQMVQQALATRKASPKELAEIREILNRYEKENLK